MFFKQIWEWFHYYWTFLLVPVAPDIFSNLMLLCYLSDDSVNDSDYVEDVNDADNDEDDDDVTHDDENILLLRGIRTILL